MQTPTICPFKIKPFTSWRNAKTDVIYVIVEIYTDYWTRQFDIENSMITDVFLMNTQTEKVEKMNIEQFAKYAGKTLLPLTPIINNTKNSK